MNRDSLKLLFAEFPKEDVHWRAQSVTKDGTKAMALAYIDARDVMDRLDQVLGAENWQEAYTETATGRVICTISIRIADEWISKSDGAGATGMEGEKGGISDAFKRCAVKWGVGRYLYDMPTPWVPCESYDRNNKKVWSRWTADPWDLVRSKSDTSKPKASAAKMKEGLADIDNDLIDCATVPDVMKCADTWKHIFERDGWSQDYVDFARPKFSQRIAAIKDAVNSQVQAQPDPNEIPFE